MPSACVSTNASGSAIERSTWVSAAKLTIASTPASALGDRGGVLDRAVDERASRRRPQVLAPAGVGELVEDDDLVAVLGARMRAKCEPMNPAPPQTRASCGAPRWRSRWAGRPVAPVGQAGASSRSVPSTEKAGRGAGRPSSALEPRCDVDVGAGAPRTSPRRGRTRSSARRRRRAACRSGRARRPRPARRRGGRCRSGSRPGRRRRSPRRARRRAGASCRRSSCRRAEHPGGADDRVARGARAHGELAGELGAPVGADRADRRRTPRRARSRRPRRRSRWRRGRRARRPWRPRRRRCRRRRR